MSGVLLIFLLLTAQAALHAVELTFPKLAVAKRIQGKLVGADFIRQSSQFRTEKGELMETG